MREKLDSYHTCQECKKITVFCKFLDDKPICFSCLDNKLHGKPREQCASRGYHETSSTSTDSSRCRDESMTSGRVFWSVDAGCRCGAQATFYDLETFPEKGRMGRDISKPPRFWKLSDNNKPIAVDVI